MGSVPDSGIKIPESDPITLSTRNVQILSCPPALSDNVSALVSDKLEAHEMPGYQVCSHVADFMTTAVGRVPKIKVQLGRDDIFSTLRVRCGIGRQDYRVAPGLYAVGDPDTSSEVMVTANFKLTFDHLRRHLKELNVWVLVLNTRGVNVWCAAGKGTFSTNELVYRIENCGLGQVVTHKRLIVPQLGATGISARAVKDRSGFRVVYGPIRSRDIRAFLENHRQASLAMRRVTFTAMERFVLTPVEVRIVARPVFLMALALVLISGIGPQVFSMDQAWLRGRAGLVMLLAGVFSGAVLTPILLPWLPFRQFGAKGIVAGSAVAALCLYLIPSFPGGMSGAVALFLFSVAVSSYLAMSFTGATPFTSPSGVEKEMKRFIPVQLVLMALATVLWIYSGF